MDKQYPLQYLKGIGPRRAGLLAKMGIISEQDLLYHFPRRYEDRTTIKPLRELRFGEIETAVGNIFRVEEIKPRRGLSIIKARLRDETGTAAAVWYNQPYLKKQLLKGEKIIVTGKVKACCGEREITVSEYEEVSEEDSLHTGRIVPFYPSTGGLTQRVWREIMQQVCKHAVPDIKEIFSPRERERQELLEIGLALQYMHYPPDFSMLDKARYRLVFEEFFLLQLALSTIRKVGGSQKPGIAHNPDNSLGQLFLDSLPFALTGAQNRVIQEVSADMEAKEPMQRLIQGDVGSGKTVIAAWALLKAGSGGYQGVMMAPTEILARQHFESLKNWFEPLNIKTALLTGSVRPKDKQDVLQGIAEHRYQIVVGTHALIQENVYLDRIGVIVIDEQHRFGVRQRSLLEEKAQNPDILVMSATPIPRTLAMTVYGDLDISNLDEMPPGRKPVETHCILDKARPKLYEFLKRQLAQEAQVYVVCPLIEESETLDIKNATALAAEIAKELFPHRTGLLHGKMPAPDKEKVLEEFRLGIIRVLVATTVIEVGVNIPQATVMVVENAERFGLAQLHQLRGRVGRSSRQSYCILVTSGANPVSLQRLKVMTITHDGFKIAEEDLRLRGPGEFFGMRQHGLPEFKAADLTRDAMILSRARQLALQTIKEDPGLKKPEHQNLSIRVWEIIKDMIKY